MKTLAIYVLILAILTAGINGWYLAFNRTDPNWTDKFKAVPDQIQICNFGSSHGMCGYNYEDIDEGRACFNFALTSQTLSYDCRILSCYQDRIKEGAVVFLTVSYFSFFGVEESKEEDFEAKNKQYYAFLPPDQIKNYSLKTALFEKYFPSLAAYEQLPLVLLGFRRDNRIQEEQWSHSAEGMDLKADGEAACIRHLVTDRLDDKGKRIYNQEEIDALYELIWRCRSLGAEPILVTTPYCLEYREAVAEADPDFYDDFYGVLRQVVKETAVRYYDYSADERFIGRKELFMNSDHLNREGARLFTDILSKEVIGE